MFPDDPPRICRECGFPPHIENCRGCYGFGVDAVSGLPINAMRLIQRIEPPGAVAPCPVCGSALDGWTRD